jgi:hypothetical protein
MGVAVLFRQKEIKRDLIMKFFVNSLAVSIVFFGAVEISAASKGLGVADYKRRKPGSGLSIQASKRLKGQNDDVSPKEEGEVDQLTGAMIEQQPEDIQSLFVGPPVCQKRADGDNKEVVFLSAFGIRVREAVLQRQAAQAQAQGHQKAWDPKQFDVEVRGGMPRWHREQFPDHSSSETDILKK